MSLPMPPPGSRVGLVLRDGRELFGDVLAVKMMSGRWPVKVWGLEERTWCIDPVDVLAVEVVDLPPERIREIAEKQRAELNPDVAHGRRVGTDASNQARRKRTMRAGRDAKKEKAR